MSGAGWNYKITLIGTKLNSWFVRTGLGLWGSTDGLTPQSINGTLYVSNPEASSVILNVESLSDINNNWGVANP